MAESSTKWTLNPDTFGMTLDQLATTQLPKWEDITQNLELALPQPPHFTRIVDDFSPDFDSNGASILKIAPFSELNSLTHLLQFEKQIC